MKITSMDIDNKEFKKSFRGYDVDEVNDFLDQIADDYGELYKENSMLREKVSMYEEKVEHYKNIEETIQNTLVLAQGASEQAKLSAQKEAEIIIKNANDSAQRILDKAHNDVLKINDDYERIKQEFEKFRGIYRNFMNSQIEMFERLERDFEHGYNIGQGIREGLDELNTVSKKTETKKDMEAAIKEQSNILHPKEIKHEILENKTTEDNFKECKEKIQIEEKVELKEINDNLIEKISTENSLNDFIKKNKIDLSKIKTSTSDKEAISGK